MAKHKPSTVYCAYKIGTYPNANISTVNKTQIKIAIHLTSNGFTFVTTRKFAKMLARRINQCLEDTK